MAVIETAWNPEKEVYTAQTASDVLPYGTYTIAETATDSYLLTRESPAKSVAERSEARDAAVPFREDSSS